MDEKSFCQSCGRILEIGILGTNLDKMANNEYCKYCYEDGKFCEPNLTIEEMMGRMSADMIDDKNMTREDAEDYARNIIPTLKRWKN